MQRALASTRTLMGSRSPRWLVFTGALCVLSAHAAASSEPDASALLRAAFDNWRADSSTSSVQMTIHRPDWERHLSMRSWTRGHDEALVRFTAPAKIAGNATLKLGNETWIFNPKINQVVKLPASMLSQSWMGSDFSYDDLAKAEDLLTQYTHRIVGTEHATGHTIYLIEALPKPGAPIIWGKQMAKVRDDGIFLEESYYDQDLKLVRAMTTDRIGPLGGRDYPLVLTMHRSEAPDARFNLRLPDYLFTRSNLENPR
jgi:outer membrane lipoprotein-sorting protein